MTAHAHAAESVLTDGFVHDKRAHRRILAALLTSLIAVIAAVSGLNVAQQQFAEDLGATQGAVLWIINGYTLALAALLMPIGAVGDRWGRKPLLLIGLGVFGGASLMAAVSTGPGMMIAARVIGGIGASMIMPATLSVITSSFPPEERGRAIGIWSGFAGSGGIIGLFVSAFMVDVASWRWTFVLPIALAVTGFVFTARFVPNSVETSRHRFDTAGALLSTALIGGLVLGIQEGPERGWSSTLAVAGLVVAVVALVAFIAVELRTEAPLIDLGAFRDRGLATGSVTLLVLFAAMFGSLLVLFPFMQIVLGWSALHSAAGILPMVVVMMPMSTVAPQIAKRIGSRRTISIGLAAFTAGLVTLALWASVEGGYLSVLPGIILFGLGLGFAMTPSTTVITETLPADKQGVASALNDTTRELGSAIGVALLGSVFSAGFRAAMKPAVQDLDPALAEPASEGIAKAMGVAQQAGEAGPRIVDAAQHALVDGWVRAMWVGAGMGIAILLLVIVRGPVRVMAPEVATGDLVLEPEGSA